MIIDPFILHASFKRTNRSKSQSQFGSLGTVKKNLGLPFTACVGEQVSLVALNVGDNVFNCSYAFFGAFIAFDSP